MRFGRFFRCQGTILAALSWLVFCALTTEAQPAASPELVLQPPNVVNPNGADALSPDGKRAVYSVFLDDRTFVVDTDSGRVVNFFKISTPGGFIGKTLIFSRDGNKLAVANSFNVFGGVDLFDVRTGRFLRTFQWRYDLFGGQVAGAVFSPDDRFLATGGTYLRLWKVENGQLLRQFSGHAGGVASVAVSADGKTLASAGIADNAVRFWSLETGEQLRLVERPPGKQALALAFSRDGQTLRAFTADRQIVSWNAATAKETAAFAINAESVRFSPDGETLSAFDAAYQKTVWNLATRKQLVEKKTDAPTAEIAEIGKIKNLLFNPPAAPRSLLLSSSYEPLKRFPMVEGQPVSSLTEADEKIFAYSPDGKLLAAGEDYGGRIKLRDAATGAVVREFTGEFQSVKALVFSPDGKLIVAGTGSYDASGNSQRTVLVWDVETGAPKIFGENFDGSKLTAVQVLSLTADGKTLFTADAKNAFVLDFESGKIKFTYPKGEYEEVALSPDGKLLAASNLDASGSEYGTLLWEVETGARVRELLPSRPANSSQGSQNSALVFSPDGKILAVGTREGAIELWDPATGAQLGALAGQRNQIEKLVFDADGKTLASVGQDGEAAFWRIADGRMLANLYLIGKEDWAVVAPDGRFEATPNARRFFHWLETGKPVAFEKFAARFETKDLLAKVFPGKSDNGAFRFKNAMPPLPAVKIEVDSAQTAGGTAEIRVEIDSPGGSFADFELRQNGALIAAEKPDGFRTESGGRLTKTYRARLAPGANQFQAYAFTSNGTSRAVAQTIAAPSGKIPNGQREIIVSSGHRERIWSLAESPDGRFLASLSNDRTVKLWDARSGRELRTLSVENGGFASIAFSPDGKILATGKASTGVVQDPNTETILWEAATGERLRTFAERGANSAAGVPAVAFSRDGSRLASCVGAAELYEYGSRRFECAKIVVRELAGGRQIRIFEDKAIGALTFNADGGALIFAAGKTVKFVELATGREIRRLEGHEKEITALALSPNGKTLASAAADQTVKLWDAGSGSLLANLTGHGKSVNVVVFSPNGEKFLSGGDDGTLRLWRVSDGAPLSVIRAAQNFSNNYIYAAAFAVGGEFVAGGLDKGSIKIWNAADGAERRELRRQTETVNKVLIKPDGNLLSIGERQTANWSLSRLRLDEIVSGGIGSAAWQQKYGEIGRNIAFSADFKKVAALDWANKQILVVDLETKEEKKFSNLPAGQAEFSYSSHLTMSGDGRFIGALGDAGIKIWSVADGRETILTKQQIYAGAFVLNRDGSRAALSTTIGEIGIWDVAANKFRLLREISGDDQMAVDLAFSPDGSLLAAALKDGAIKIWELSTGAIRQTLGGHKGGTKSVVFHPLGKLLMSGGADGRTRLWDWQAGKEVMSLIAVDERDFIAITPDGFYTASKFGAQSVSVRQDGEAIAFEQFDYRFNRPDILLERAGLAAPQTIEFYRQTVKKRLVRFGLTDGETSPGENVEPPALSLVSAAPPAQTRQRTLVLRLRAEDKKFPLHNLQATVNGVPLFTAEGLQPETQTKIFEREIKFDLQRGVNKIRILAVNERGVSSRPLEFETRLETDFTKPNLYLVAVGVSEYLDSANNLQFAAKDADDLAKFFESKRPRFGSVEVLRLFDKDATRQNILTKAREFLLRAGVEDEIVVFISGHGMLDANRDYFYGTYDIDFKNPADKGLPFGALEDLLDGLQARKKLLLIDTCHAGEADKDEQTRARAEIEQGKAKNAGGSGDANFVRSRGVEIIRPTAKRLGLQDSFDLLSELFTDFRGSSGTQIIAAASGLELAYERGDLKNGVFTFSLLEALNDESADTSGDGKLQVFELRDYVNDRVISLTNGVQKPVMRKENIEFDFAVF